MSAAQVVEVLDQAVDWYRTLGIQQNVANEPSDMLILYDNRQTASKFMSLAFAVARINANMLGKLPSSPSAGAEKDDSGVSSQSLLQLQQTLETQSASIQAELDTEPRQQMRAAGSRRVQLQAKVNELQGELNLVNAKKTIIATMKGFTAVSAGHFDVRGPGAVVVEWSLASGSRLLLEVNLSDAPTGGFGTRSAPVFWQEGTAQDGVLSPWSVRWSSLPGTIA